MLPTWDSVFLLIFLFSENSYFINISWRPLQVYYCIFLFYANWSSHDSPAYGIFAYYFVVEFINFTEFFLLAFISPVWLQNDQSMVLIHISQHLSQFLLFHVHLIILKSDIWNFIYVSIWILYQDICDCKGFPSGLVG